MVSKHFANTCVIESWMLYNLKIPLYYNVNILPQVPSARNSGGTPASPAPHTYQKVPAEPRDRHVVPHLHVGGHLPQEHRPSRLVSKGTVLG